MKGRERMKYIAVLLCLMLCLYGCEAQHGIQDQTGSPAEEQPERSPAAEPTSEPAAQGTPAPEEPFTRVGFNGTIFIDMDFDGLDETISVTQKDDGTAAAGFSDGDTNFSDTIDPLYVTECFIDDVMKGDGYLELFVTGDMASDDYVTYIYRIKDGATQKCEIYGIVKESDGCGSLLVQETIDVFGTYGAECRYTLTNGFGFEVSSPYTVLHEGYEDRKITVKRDGLPAQASALGGEYEDVLLPSGTELLLTETDCASYGLFKADGDKSIRIAITSKPGEWGWYIGGVLEEEWFDGLSYSG
jgi:hypothetical protein